MGKRDFVDHVNSVEPVGELYFLLILLSSSINYKYYLFCIINVLFTLVSVIFFIYIKYIFKLFSSGVE